MSTDFADKEREFLESLKADTGRDLSEWLSAIDAENLPHRNEIIDWLRQQGFIFSRASWLERIHANGGKPIYLSAVPESLPAPATSPRLRERQSANETAPQTPTTPVPPSPPSQAAQAKPRLVPAPADPRPEPANENNAPRPAPAPPTHATMRTTDEAALQATIASAKAYAPLCGFLLREIAAHVPDCCAVPGRGHIALHALDEKQPPSAVIAISARELRLAITLTPPQPPFQLGQLTGPAQGRASGMTSLITLTDARQIDATLLSIITRAFTNSNGN